MVDFFSKVVDFGTQKWRFSEKPEWAMLLVFVAARRACVRPFVDVQFWLVYRILVKMECGYKKFEKGTF